MDKFTKNLLTLENLIFSEEADSESNDDHKDDTKALELIKKIISSCPKVKSIENLERFLSIIFCTMADGKSDDLYNRITDWIMSQYNQSKSEKSPDQFKIADLLLSWLNHKIEGLDELGKSKEVKLSLTLLTDIISGRSNASNNTTTNDYQGYATYAMLVGLAEKDDQLIEDAVAAQSEVLRRFCVGHFPDYYNIEYFIAKKRSALASTLMKAYGFDNDKYEEYLDEIGLLLEEAAEKLEFIGTDFDKDYTRKLQEKYKSYLPSDTNSDSQVG